MEECVNKEAQAAGCHTCNDEIDLVQLVQILLKRKFLVLGVTLFCLFAGGAYVFLKKPVYNYTTSLQIGTVLIEGKGSLERAAIEAPPSVKLKLEKVYIPTAIAQLSGKTTAKLPAVHVKDQKNSSIVLITSKAGKDDSQLLRNLHTMIVATLIANHRESIAVLKKQYEIEVERANLILKDLEDPNLFGLKEETLRGKIKTAQLQLEGFDDQKRLLLAQKKGLDETKKLLVKQIDQIEKNLKLSYEKRNKAISETGNAAKAMTFLMLNSDIQQNENQLATLRERLYVKLENEKQKLESQLAETQRAREQQVATIEELKGQLLQLQAQRLSEQEKQRNVIAAAKNKINLYQNTKALSVAMCSTDPVEPRKFLILALAGILGLMGGVMLAFGAEFMTKVKNNGAAGEV